MLETRPRGAPPRVMDKGSRDRHNALGRSLVLETEVHVLKRLSAFMHVVTSPPPRVLVSYMYYLTINPYSYTDLRTHMEKYHIITKMPNSERHTQTKYT